MKFFFCFLAWFVVLVLCWPLAMAALILFPIVWLIALPLRLVALVVDACFSLLKAVLFLPARVLNSMTR